VAEQASAPAPAAESKPSEGILGGAWYWIRWGDTLWGISASFYKNPWLYDSIARHNSIPNPDLIYAGSRIYIPEKR
jgi:nucleoid-associated protein YgaU